MSLYLTELLYTHTSSMRRAGGAQYLIQKQNELVFDIHLLIMTPEEVQGERGRDANTVNSTDHLSFE